MLRDVREADSLRHAYAVFGSMILIIGVTSAVVTFLAKKWRGWLILALLILCLGLLVAFFGTFWIDMEKGEVHRRQIQEEIRSGRYDFADQPALLAVAQAISANIRTRCGRQRRTFQICRHQGGTERRCFAGP
jgi:uncharacterized membrane protein HdeD (DUF308 family)